MRLADQLTVRIDPAERSGLEKLALAEKRSIGYVAREAIRAYLNECPGVYDTDNHTTETASAA